MSGPEWIVCESTSRWAAALRLATERDPRCRAGRVRLYETRQLPELTQRLTQQPHGFAVVEVREDSVGEVLGWLSWATGRFGGARCVALLDRSLASGESDIVDALLEAGRSTSRVRHGNCSRSWNSSGDTRPRPTKRNESWRPICLGSSRFGNRCLGKPQGRG